MRLRFLIFWIVSILVALCRPGIGAELPPVRLVGDAAWEPFYGPDLPEGGFVMVLVREAFAKAGREVVISYQPWTRALLTTEMSRNDAAVGAYYTADRAKTFFYSDPFYTNDVVLISLKGREITFSGDVDALRPYRIGVIQDNAYNPGFDAADYLAKESVTHPRQNLKKLFLGRIDVMAETRAIALYWIGQNPDHKAAEIKILQPALTRHDLHLIVSRSNPKAAEILESFNRGVTLLRESGEYRRILLRFQVAQ